MFAARRATASHGRTLACKTKNSAVRSIASKTTTSLPTIKPLASCSSRLGRSTTASSIVIRRSLMTTAARRQQSEQDAPREMDSGEKDIHDILTREFQPRQLQVQDVSGGCGSFYSIAIISSKFKGVPTVKAHRMVNDALKDIIKGIHGLQLRTIPADD